MLDFDYELLYGIANFYSNIGPVNLDQQATFLSLVRLFHNKKLPFDQLPEFIVYLKQKEPIPEWSPYKSGNIKLEWAEQWRIETNLAREKSYGEEWLRKYYLATEWSLNRITMRVDGYNVQNNDFYLILVAPNYVADQLQNILDIFEIMKEKGISLENGFYDYWVENYGDSKKGRQLLLHHLARIHTLQSRHLKKSWNIFTNRFLLDEWFIDSSLPTFMKAAGLPPGAPIKDDNGVRVTDKNGQWQWTLPIDDSSDTGWRWEIMPSGSILLEASVREYSVCAGRPLKKELNIWMDKYNSIIEKEGLGELK